MKLPWTKRVARSAEPARPLTVFDVVQEVSYVRDEQDPGKITLVLIVFKPRPANAPWKSGREMMADYPDCELNHDKPGMEYTAILRGESAQRFHEGFERHRNAQLSGHREK